MPAIYRGENLKHFQEIMGRGGVISSRPRQEQPETQPSAGPAVAGSRPHMSKEVLDQLAQEIKEQMGDDFPLGTGGTTSSTGEK